MMKVILMMIAVFSSVLCGEVLRGDDVLELIDKAGYIGKAYEVETEDGYLLKLHRILSKNDKVFKHPVFLMHGLFAASADFVVTGPKIALAYLLADNGYDVWMGNARGNKHSTKHKQLSWDSNKFWNFSWHEIGYYDLPAMIDYTLNATNSSKAFYVGHSQGTTSLLALLSSRPDYNQKIIQAHLLAPAAFISHCPHPLAKNAAQEVKNGIFNGLKFLNFDSIWDLAKEFSKVFCVVKTTTLPLCRSVIFYIVGVNKNKIEIDDVTCICIRFNG
jgi:pimeloyl-ACP methyl ester carboxylesterase